jgi:hypothetical protein
VGLHGTRSWSVSCIYCTRHPVLYETKTFAEEIARQSLSKRYVIHSISTFSSCEAATAEISSYNGEVSGDECLYKVIQLDAEHEVNTILI